ncbi:MAG: sugar phosphate isomerase/epimerase [Phycisphaeraceae bacterium]|nr:sugar phosphate isomerase/epimerase [Phycisphaerales bacterium]QOJ18399.1 MAG: sugar phosphate isomerase/epimerase [Phycisphaeraceae bacterium]
MNRRTFLKTNTLALAATGAATLIPEMAGSLTARRRSSRAIKLAVKFGMVAGPGSVREKFSLLKELGYDGVELDAPSNLDKNEVREAIESTGLPVHGVVDSVHWSKPFSHPDPAVRAEGVKALEIALQDCRAYGGDTVLVVPAVVNKQVSYADAYERSQREIRRVLPLAKELGIRIAFENVWNKFLLSPLEAARYVDEFEHPDVVGWYFDVGNIVTDGWPEHWVRILGRRIFKLDIKEFSRKKRDEEGLWKGFNVEIGEGDCDWPAVTAALDEIGYSGWATAEVGGGGRERLADILSRMRRVLHGA